MTTCPSGNFPMFTPLLGAAAPRPRDARGSRDCWLWKELPNYRKAHRLSRVNDEQPVDSPDEMAVEKGPEAANKMNTPRRRMAGRVLEIGFEALLPVLTR